MRQLKTPLHNEGNPLRKGDRFWSAALPGSQHPAEDSGVKIRGNIGRNELFPIFGSAYTLRGSSARLSPGAERSKEMKEVKNEEVCNSFGSLSCTS